MSFQSYDYIVFGSSGLRIFLYEGALRAMERHIGETATQSWRQGVRGVAGVSGGALYALVYALGLSESTRRDIMQGFDPYNLISMHAIDQSLLTCGISDTQPLHEVLHEVLIHGGLSPMATLQDLSRFVQKDVVFVATDLVASTHVLLGARTYPHVRIVDAVCASCAVPFVYRPVLIDGTPMVDGGLTASVPRGVFDDAQTLFMCPATFVVRNPLANWKDYLQSIVQCVTVNNSAFIEALLPAQIVQLGGGGATHGCEVEMNVDDMVRQGFVSALCALNGVDVAWCVSRLCALYLHAVVKTDIDDEHPPCAVLEPRSSVDECTKSGRE